MKKAFIYRNWNIIPLIQMTTSKKITEIIERHQKQFHKVVPFESSTDKALLLDFTAENVAITPEILNDIKTFSNYIEKLLLKSNARYGIGGYGEHRTIYNVSTVFDGKVSGDEPRRLHLGIDIWGKADTTVMAPLDGLVHSFAFNDQFGDYGATIILEHKLENIIFYTLYGHLSLNSIKNLHKRQLIKRGETFAEFGLPIENGHWPPHLHFQIIINMEDKQGDYPGVCRFSEKEKYISNCPNPDLILQMLLI